MLLKVLFVTSSNKKGRISPFILSQANSLRNRGMSVEFFTLTQGGLKGYFRNIFRLRRALQREKYDFIHAHYALMGFICSFARTSERLVVSLMGCDILGSYKSNGDLIWSHQIIVYAAKVFSRLFWDFTILKSSNMASRLFPNSRHEVIPNGLDMDLFKVMDKKYCRERLEFSEDTKYILFPTDPDREEKNYQLAKSAFELVKKQIGSEVELIVVHNLLYEELVIYYNAVDVCIMSSRSEGSPNVIKECMACSLSIVSTDVGDVKELISDTNGCYISEPDPENFASKICEALKFNQKTNGREKVKHLEINLVADRIINVYNHLIS